MSISFQLLIVASLFAQTESPESKTSDADVEKQQVDKWMELYAKVAAGYQFETAGDRTSKLQFHPKPVLRWMNPVLAGVTTGHGAVVVWTSDGCADAVGTIFSYIPAYNNDERKRLLVDEFHSVSSAPLVAARKIELPPFWKTDGPGVELKLVPTAPDPAASAPPRLTQMRNMARQFSAEFQERGVWSELRLLPQPLYRYESKRPDILDGGVFAFVTGTDAEIILLIEARKSDKGFEWQYGIARFTHLPLRVRHEETEVWKVDLLKGAAATSRPKDVYQAAYALAIYNTLLP